MESPDQESFGEASLGDAQSENPPSDPEMINDAAAEEPEDPDADATATPDLVDEDSERDQAEG